MIAAVLTQPKKFSLEKTTASPINNDEVKVRVEGCGICSSSTPLWEGREWFRYPNEPGAPGHEGWGIVEEIGDAVTGISIGNRVAFLSYHAYAEYDKAHYKAVVVIPEELRNIPFPGEPLGCAMNIFERSAILPGHTVAIVGSGFLGVLLCQLCKAAGAKVIAISKRAYSREVAAESGADEVVQFNDRWQAANQVSEITGNQLCHRVIEATGKQEGLDLATEIIAEYGRLIIAGYHQDGQRQVDVQKWNWKAIDVINAHERDPQRYLHGMKQAVAAVIGGRMNPGKLYTDIFSLDEINKGFELTTARPPGFMKALIRICQTPL